MKKENNNKGFTLVELVVAIAVLAIAITPILTSFITSAKLNVKSRKMMAATNIAQSLMEGYADKTYTEVLNICKKKGTGSGKYIFSTVSSNAYNDASAWDRDPSHFTYLTTKAGNTNNPAQITWNGVSKPTNLIYDAGSDSEAVYNAMLGDLEGVTFASAMYSVHSSGDAQKVGYWTDSKESILAMYYTNIKEGNFNFDAIVVFVPAAKTKDDIYYPYYVNIYLYDLSKVKSQLDYKKARILTYTSGIKNISQKGSTER